MDLSNVFVTYRRYLSAGTTPASDVERRCSPAAEHPGSLGPQPDQDPSAPLHAKKVAKAILAKLSGTAGNEGREERKAIIERAKADWDRELAAMDHEEDDPGTTWNERARKRSQGAWHGAPS